MEDSTASSIAHDARNKNKRNANEAGLQQPTAGPPPAPPAQQALVPAHPHTQPQQPLPQRSVTAPAPTLQVGAPPTLIASLKASARLGAQLYRNQEFQVYTAKNVHLNALVTGLAHATLDALRVMLENEHALRLVEIQELLANSFDTLRDTYGRALYARMKHIADVTRIEAGRFRDRPTFNRTTPLPAFVARALNSIGIFRPDNVSPDVAYLPSSENEVTNTGGIAAHARFIQYIHLVHIFARLAIPTSTLETRDINGSGYWLLRTEGYPQHAVQRYDIIAPVPTSNFSDTDALTFVYLLKTHSDMEPQCAFPPAIVAQPLVGNYGSIFRGLMTHEVSTFVLAEFGVPNDVYVSGLLP